MKKEYPDENGLNSGETLRESPEDYYARPHGNRRELTANDLKRNRGVDRLFSVVTPGIPIDADPGELRTDAERISLSVEKILKRFNIQITPWISELREIWTQIVPKEVSDYAVPGKCENGILYLYVTTSGHLFNLRRQWLKTIETAVKKFAGDRITIRQVRLMVDTLPPSPNRHA